ncbi:MAG: DNA-3-methyladenine glycosylase 2 family protein [Methanosarcinaceae archaeon]|nr:DNA-3-methyladenine glycosylase 2 family protein [Methanosarcinaceae archaeon]
MHSFSTLEFKLDHTLDCGQVFRWEREGDRWVGVVNGEVVRTWQDSKTMEVLIDSKNLPMTFFVDYFRLDDDLPYILNSIDRDQYIHEAIKKYRGLRIIRQKPWECLVSYMLATASSIPTIKKRISLLCRMFGVEIETGFYSFPDARTLANANVSDLCECKLGFRAGRIQKVAQMVSCGELCFDELFEMDFHNARIRLMEVEGIGEKVADCVLLFSFGKLDSFPVDTHVRQFVEINYADDEYFSGKLNSHKIGEWGRRYFGEFCGYAQEYLYYHKRVEHQ